ncbi:MAG: 4-hydroxy-tetrahydrodipicolinate synthase [SAR86 cluster bacterium]|uniref:4-hydroxy-tetrahydrodipicolinate synthase n=1 Tax=SAR86 cluster bacterium TaxID=2030880 RepID=A0A2A4MM03_9GAMM|nr:MAG: 4-hydroxy-tetrahydrodipicolinate synthase [SAR86 cluster bacterium]
MIEGSIVAIVTPMNASGDIDYQAFDSLIEWHIDSGTDALVVVGTTGESATLSHQEHCKLVEYCVTQVNGRLPVIAGTGSNSTAEALFFTQSAKEHGADACLLVTPYYNRPTQEGLYQHFKHIADTVDIPQILYNVPSRTGCDLLPATVDRLADGGNIIGIKEATGDLSRAQEIIALSGDRLAVYCGDDAIAVEMMLAGAKGNISVTANVAPKLMQQLCKSAIAGDRETAEGLDQQVAALHRDLFVEPNPVPVKWALQQMGKISTGIRLPLVELDSQFHVKVREALQQAAI